MIEISGYDGYDDDFLGVVLCNDKRILAKRSVGGSNVSWFFSGDGMRLHGSRRIELGVYNLSADQSRGFCGSIVYQKVHGE